MKFRESRLKKSSPFIYIMGITILIAFVLKLNFSFKGFTLDYILLCVYFVLSIAFNKKYREKIILNMNEFIKR